MAQPFRAGHADTAVDCLRRNGLDTRRSWHTDDREGRRLVGAGVCGNNCDDANSLEPHSDPDAATATVGDTPDLCINGARACDRETAKFQVGSEHMNRTLVTMLGMTCALASVTVASSVQPSADR